jgi:rhodanese-related sulfurtransferase
VSDGIDDLLEQERRLLDRLTPEQAREAAAAGGLIIDTRSHEQRRAGGTVPGSVRIHRNVLEWRVDPSSGYQDPRIAACRGPLVIMCQQGYSSTLAAATLQRLGIMNATDMEGGFEAWAAAGLPVEPVGDVDETAT